MSKKLTGRALAEFEAGRDVWQEVLDGVREIKAGGGRPIEAELPSPIVQARMKAGLTQAQFAKLLGVSKRTLEQWEQGRREPSGAAKTLIKVAELHPEVLREIAA
jgi:putative transcriptional regulator